jgi:hypothetical protein
MPTSAGFARKDEEDHAAGGIGILMKKNRARAPLTKPNTNITAVIEKLRLGGSRRGGAY